jgi:hypothetical protein
MELITGFIASKAAAYVGGSIAAFVLGWILKKIPTGKWSKSLGEVGQKNGKAVTEFCNKKIPLWNKVIEPVFIDTIGVVLSWFSGFIIGLKSDNEEK